MWEMYGGLWDGSGFGCSPEEPGTGTEGAAGEARNQVFDKVGQYGANMGEIWVEYGSWWTDSGGVQKLAVRWTGVREALAAGQGGDTKKAKPCATLQVPAKASSRLPLQRKALAVGQPARQHPHRVPDGGSGRKSAGSGHVVHQVVAASRPDWKQNFRRATAGQGLQPVEGEFGRGEPLRLRGAGMVFVTTGQPWGGSPPCRYR